MKDYEETKYTHWRENLESTLMTYLKKNLLVKAVNTPSSTKQHSLGDEEKSNLDESEGTMPVSSFGLGTRIFLISNFNSGSVLKIA